MAPVQVEDDYYDVLEISNTATLEVVTRSYRRLAKIRHPDKNLVENSTAVFQLLQNAYDTISDPEKRRVYDVRWAGIRDRLRAKHESDKRRTETEEARKRREAEERTKNQKEDDVRQARLWLWQGIRTRYDGDIFEINRLIRKLTADLKRFQDQDDENMRKERARNGWWAYMTSPIYGKIDETDEEKRAQETERLHRLASTSIKGAELRAHEAKVKRLQNELEDINSKIAAENERRAEEARARIREENLRREQETRNQAEQKMREVLIRMQKEQAERASREAREGQAAQEARERRDRARKEAEETRQREAEERAKATRAAQERARKEAEETRQREAEERAKATRAAQERVGKSFEEVVAQAEERAKATRAAQERVGKSFEEVVAQAVRAKKRPTQSSGRAHGSTKTVCRHDKFWPKLEGSHTCSSCHTVQRRFAFQCPGCGMMACATCRQTLRGEKRKTFHPGPRFQHEKTHSYDAFCYDDG